MGIGFRKAIDRLSPAVPAFYRIKVLLLLADFVCTQTLGRSSCGTPPTTSTLSAAGSTPCEKLQLTRFSIRGKDQPHPTIHARGVVEPMHPELAEKAILVSGHHSKFQQQTDRYIIDASGGGPSASQPIQALVLPERNIIVHTD